MTADRKVTADAVRNLRDGNPDASFVYLGNTDVVAHSSGTGSQYIAAIEKQDAQLGQMLGAIQARPTYSNPPHGGGTRSRSTPPRSTPPRSLARHHHFAFTTSV